MYKLQRTHLSLSLHSFLLLSIFLSPFLIFFFLLKTLGFQNSHNAACNTYFFASVFYPVPIFHLRFNFTRRFHMSSKKELISLSHSILTPNFLSHTSRLLHLVSSRACSSCELINWQVCTKQCLSFQLPIFISLSRGLGFRYHVLGVFPSQGGGASQQETLLHPRVAVIRGPRDTVNRKLHGVTRRLASSGCVSRIEEFGRVGPSTGEGRSATLLL